MTRKSRKLSRRRALAKRTAPAAEPVAARPSTPKGGAPSKGVPGKGRFARFLHLSDRQLVLLCLCAISGLAFFVRSLHLLDSGHYFIISADSHVFHWMADLVMGNQAIPNVFPTGLAYPLAYIATAVGFVFRLSDQDALTFASKFLPPFLSVLTIIVIYLAVSRMYNRRMGLAAGLAWAVLPHAYFIQGAGYLDRDGLSILLITLGVFAFFMSKNWHLSVRRRDVGWVFGALLVVGLELMLYLEWSWVGSGLLLTIIGAFFASELVLKFAEYQEPFSTTGYQPFWKRLLGRVKGAVSQSRWRPFAVIFSLNVLVACLNRAATSRTFDFIDALLSPGGGEIAEMGGLGFSDLVLFQLFLLLIPIGLLLAFIRHREADVLFVSWFLVMFILSLFARRLILYAAPAAAVVGGMVVANLFDLRYTRGLERAIQTGVAAVIVAILIVLSAFAYYQGSESRVAANNDWYDGLTWIRDNTPEDAVVMSWWDYGYWILDVAERKPVVDGGMYGHVEGKDDDVGLAYCTGDALEAVQVMNKHEADYLVFSNVEREILSTIASHGLAAGENLQDSLYWRSLSGSFQCEGGLERVYPGPEVQNPDLVILRIVQ